jgi:hypothetical protein
MSDNSLWVATLFVVLVVISLPMVRWFTSHNGGGLPRQGTEAERESRRWELIGALLFGGGYVAWIVIRWRQTGDFPSRSEMF